jgi:hypothetical protein
MTQKLQATGALIADLKEEKVSSNEILFMENHSTHFPFSCWGIKPTVFTQLYFHIFFNETDCNKPFASV